MSEDHVGDAHDAARLAARRRCAATRARARGRAAVRGAARSTSTARTGASRRRPRQRSTPLPESGMHLGALMTGRAAAGVVGRQRAAGRPTSSRPRACSRRCCDALRVPWSVSRGARAVPAPGPRGARARRRPTTPAGSASCTRAVARAWDLERRVAGFELDLGVIPHAAPLVPHYEDLTSFPAVARTSRCGSRRDVRGGRRWSRSCARRAARCCATCESSTSIRARGTAFAGACGSSSARATARSPTRRSRRGATKIVRGRGRAPRGRARVAESVAVLGAAGYAGAIAAQLLYRHPHFELALRDRAGGRGPAARRRPPAHARAAGARGLRP